VDALVQDFRYGLRMLAKSPVFTAAAVVTLALGIGANAAIFSLANALLWKGVPGVDTEGLAAVYTDRGEGPSVSSYMDYVDFREQSGSTRCGRCVTSRSVTSRFPGAHQPAFPERLDACAPSFMTSWS